VSVFRSSVTQTYRPGATVKLNWQFDNHRLVAGYWFERARHKQTQPAVKLNADGSVPNYWLDSDDQDVKRANGSNYQGRDQLTVSNGSSLFLMDTISLMNDKLLLIPAIKTPRLDRKFTNFANDFNNTFAAVTYTRFKTDKSTNPSLGFRYSVTEAHQVFANISKGSKTTNNFNLAASGLVSGALVFPTIKQETSVTTDAGYRFLSDVITFSGSLFNTSFKDRISRAYDPVSALTIDSNVGKAEIRGVELEAGTKAFYGFSVYSSYSYTKATFKEDYRFASSTATLTGLLPSAGKEFPDTPKHLGAVTLQYADGPFLAGIQGKYTGMRYSSIVNDEKVGGFTQWNFNMGYRLPNADWIKNVTLRFNMSNFTDKKYLLLNAGSGSSFVTNAKAITGVTTFTNNVFYYVGAPRFSSISLQADF